MKGATDDGDDRPLCALLMLLGGGLGRATATASRAPGALAAEPRKQPGESDVGEGAWACCCKDAAAAASSQVFLHSDTPPATLHTGYAIHGYDTTLIF